MFFIRMMIPKLLSELAKAIVIGINAIIPALIKTGISLMASGVQFFMIKKERYK